MKQKKSLKWPILIAAVFFLAALLVIEYIALTRSNRVQAYKTSEVLIGHVKSILENTEKREETLVRSLKEDYITRARAVSYIVDSKPEIEADLKELKLVAKLINVDEIHLFDTKGTIYSGTVPKYYGYSFDSGEQMAFFKPMLTNKDLAMCQDVTPNTAEQKMMMYAICWDDKKEKMVQVGIEPVRLLEELRSGEISEVVASMPYYDGTSYIVAERTTGTVVGATNRDSVGRNLSDFGIDCTSQDFSGIVTLETQIDGKNTFCALSEYRDYVLMAVLEGRYVDSNVMPTLWWSFLYLMIALFVMAFISINLTSKIIAEKTFAITDQLTSLYNRRAYADEFEKYETRRGEQNLVYASLDINGLKEVNDKFGHAAGDELIKGVADCISQSFGNLGKLFRIGGDEFAMILHADEPTFEGSKAKFLRTVDAWRGRFDNRLSVSLGIVRSEEYPDKEITELAKIADSRMYHDKELYYTNSGKDRRKR